jgi:gamma-glutamyltranspeptidase
MRRLDEVPIIESPDTISIQLRADNANSNSTHANYFDKDSALNSSKGLRRIVIITLIFSLIVTFALLIQILFGPNQVSSRIGIITPEQQCSEIGAQMIRQNGNSVDAFIATALCLGVVNPFSAGFGAGGFLVVRDHKYNKNLAINCWFKSGSIDINVDFQESTTFVAIPGELKCLQYIYHRYSHLWWPTLVSPAVKLARNGFKVSKQLAYNLRKENLSNELLKRFLRKDGKLVEENDILTNPELAAMLEDIDNDENNLYRGGKSSKDLTRNAQTLTLDDLKNYSTSKSQILLTKYQDFMLLTTHYPSNGPILKFLLDLMSKLNIKLDDLNKLEFFHRFIEVYIKI